LSRVGRGGCNIFAIWKRVASGCMAIHGLAQRVDGRCQPG
jgi:hypothetical protein